MFSEIDLQENPFVVASGLRPIEYPGIARGPPVSPHGHGGPLLAVATIWSVGAAILLGCAGGLLTVTAAATDGVVGF